MAAFGANPLFIVGGVSFLAALVASLMVQFVILQQGRKLGGRMDRIPQDAMRKYVFRENYLISDVEATD